MSGFRLRAEVYGTELADLACRLFPEYAVSTDAAEGSRGPTVRLEPGPGGYGIRSPDGSRYEYPSLAEAVEAFEYLLTELFLAAHGGLVHLHAAGAEIAGRAILAVGATGAGKSSLAVAWSIADVPTLGDDIVFLTPSNQARPFKRLYKVAAPVLSELGRDPRSTPCWIPDSDDAWFDPSDEGGWGGECPVGLFAVVRHQAGSSIKVRRLSHTEALAAAAASVIASGPLSSAEFDSLSRSLRGVPGVHLTFGSAASGACALRDALG